MIAVVLSVLIQAVFAHAYPDGATGYSGNPATRTCLNCHGGGVAPTVTFVGPATVTPGSTTEYTIRIQGGQSNRGGYNVSATGGTLVAGAGSRLSNGELTQSSSQRAVGDVVEFPFSWKAPATAGQFTLYGHGLSTNGSGTSGDNGKSITLAITVSAPAQVSVPNVVGRTQAAARTAITGAGLTVGNVTTQSSPTVPAGQVISQNPAANTSVAPGSSVDLVVSDGPDGTPPPNPSLLFEDDFSDSTSRGDVNWKAVSGRWTGNGSTFSSSEKSDNKVLVQDVLDLDSFVVGRLQTDLKLSRTRKANGAIIFGYQDRSHYRYVRLYGNKVIIGQVGTYDGQRDGIKAVGYGRFATNAWHKLQVDIYDTGEVYVYVDKEEYVTADDDDDDDDDVDSGASASYRFRSVSPGGVGYSAVKTNTLFDNFSAWDSTVLPTVPVNDDDD